MILQYIHAKYNDQIVCLGLIITSNIYHFVLETFKVHSTCYFEICS